MSPEIRVPPTREQRIREEIFRLNRGETYDALGLARVVDVDLYEVRRVLKKLVKEGTVFQEITSMGTFYGLMKYRGLADDVRSLAIEEGALAHCTGCAISYFYHDWMSLEYVGYQEVPAGSDPELEPAFNMELRNCSCGSTITALISDLIEATPGPRRGERHG